MTADVPYGPLSFTLYFKDMAGNAGTPVRATTDGSKVVFGMGPCCCTL